MAELGYKRKEIPYEQPKRRAGHTKNNFFSLFDAAMLSITSYTKTGLRMATIFGSVCSFLSILVALIYLVMKLIWWDRFPAGMAPLLIGMCVLGSIQIFFIGLVGEYIPVSYTHLDVYKRQIQGNVLKAFRRQNEIWIIRFIW